MGEIDLPPLPSDQPLDLSTLLADAEAALQQLLTSTGAREVAVVGVSVGAFVAARLLASHPQVVRGALVSPPLGVAPDGLDPDVVAGIAASGCPVVGAICMEMMVVDVTEVEGEVAIGDDVVLLGPQGNDAISADELARRIDGIVEEVFCGLSRSVPRHYRPGVFAVSAPREPAFPFEV